MKDRELFYAMDACRPGSDDLDLPEMREFKARLEADAKWQLAFRQIQRFDAVLRGPLTEVPVPATLRESVLIALGPAHVSAPAASDQQPLEEPPSVRPARAAALHGRRRRVVAALGLVATATCLLLLAWRALTQHSMDDLDAQQLAVWAVNRWAPDPTAWTDYDIARADPSYPLSRFLQVDPARWQSMRTDLDRHAVVFEFHSTGSSQIRLFALRAPRRLPRLPTHPPERPLVGSGGWYTAAWQETSYLYVLTIKDAPEDYFEVLRSRPPALAHRETRPAYPGDRTSPGLASQPTQLITSPLRSAKTRS